MFNCNDDGITHINIYSKGKTELGRFLSNFTYSPITLPDHGNFNSIEGYWYWLGTRDEKLRYLHGFAAKKYGRKLKRINNLPEKEFQSLICRAIWRKIASNPHFYRELIKSNLPLTHYYIIMGKCISPKNQEWLLNFINRIRKCGDYIYNFKLFQKDMVVVPGDIIEINKKKYKFVGKIGNDIPIGNCIYISDKNEIIIRKLNSRIENIHYIDDNKIDNIRECLKKLKGY
ncbi:MAG: hypothetical protein ACOCQD_02810 [archaeon]